ncbi:MAG TPA: anti-sigma factor [Methylomirabilota bacterium]|nr:anti-sigma factor [Methylomirabilota bacterium]
MTCGRIRELLPGYLDGALPGPERAAWHGEIGQHLAECPGCRQEMERYKELSSVMSRVERVSPPPDLAVRIRVAVSRVREEAGLPGRVRRWRDRGELVLKNILEPLALPVTGGLVVALVVFAVVIQVLGVGVPLEAVVGDSPSNLLQPARVESLAPFPITGLTDSATGVGRPLLVEATVGVDGDAVSYRIISGPTTESVRRQLDQVMMFSHFRPELSFGRPTTDGHVVLSFSEVHVRG